MKVLGLFLTEVIILVLFASTPLIAAPDAVRLTEPTGGFSYVVPVGWQVKSFVGMKFRSAFTSPVDGFAPNINVIIHQSSLPLSEYVRLVKLNTKPLIQSFPGFHWLGQPTLFVTNSGLHGLKLSSEASPLASRPELKIHQVFYCFSGRGGRRLVVTASIPTSVEDKYASLVEAAMKTFTVQ